DQFVRDARIAQIYEGANGIQALDLVGRKLAQNGGRAIRAFFDIVQTEVNEAKADAHSMEIAAALEKANGELQAATMWLMQHGMADPNNAGAASYSYMHLMGIVSLGLMWLRMTRASGEALAQGGGDKSFHEAKLITARFFAERIMPEAGALRRKLEAGAESTMALPVAAF
ncbi:MAG: acyl-CoA dehydrogenase, partial [Pseudomonadota bacterium]|nr:acyl-CoA dehydrogenase [Pseudomonadota bacterium]